MHNRNNNNFDLLLIAPTLTCMQAGDAFTLLSLSPCCCFSLLVLLLLLLFTLLSRRFVRRTLLFVRTCPSSVLFVPFCAPVCAAHPPICKKEKTQKYYSSTRNKEAKFEPKKRVNRINSFPTPNQQNKLLLSSALGHHCLLLPLLLSIISIILIFFGRRQNGSTDFFIISIISLFLLL